MVAVDACATSIHESPHHAGLPQATSTIVDDTRELRSLVSAVFPFRDGKVASQLGGMWSSSVVYLALHTHHHRNGPPLQYAHGLDPASTSAVRRGKRPARSRAGGRLSRPPPINLSRRQRLPTFHLHKRAIFRQILCASFCSPLRWCALDGAPCIKIT